LTLCLNSNTCFGNMEKSDKITVDYYHLLQHATKISLHLEYYNCLHKNNNLGPKNEHKNILYYEKYQTTDLVIFLHSTH
jgi:hypothetical protein